MMDPYVLERLERERSDKNFAHGQVTYALKKGTLVRQPCEVCGSTERIQAHHDDYSKPLEVRWLCKEHHVEADKVVKMNFPPLQRYFVVD